MPDDVLIRDERPPLEIGAALAAMPLETPERSAWPRLAERIAAVERARAPRRRHWTFALATAAALGMVSLLPRWQAGPPAVETGIAVNDRLAPAAVAGPSLGELMQESARLENLLVAMGDAAPLSASATMMSLEFDERLQRLDATLSDPSLDAESRRLLWNHRVALLRDYAGMRGTAQSIAADGGLGEAELVAVF